MVAVLDALAGALLLSIAAQVQAILPGRAVPVTAQSLGVLLLGTTLGPRRGPAAVLLYLGAGAVGLPVFAGGQAGAGHLWGTPAAGYLWGFVPAAWLAARAGAPRATQAWSRCAAAAWLALASCTVLICGGAHLAWLRGPAVAWRLGVAPFLPEALAKAALVAGLSALSWRPGAIVSPMTR